MFRFGSPTMQSMCISECKVYKISRYIKLLFLLIINAGVHYALVSSNLSNIFSNSPKTKDRKKVQVVSQKLKNYRPPLIPLQILYDHDRKVDVVTASINQEKTLLGNLACQHIISELSKGSNIHTLKMLTLLCYTHVNS